MDVYYGRNLKLSSSCQHSKELQIRESISMQAGFIGATFSWKRTGLAQVGEEGKSIRSSVLRTSIVVRMGVRELCIDWWVKVMPASPGQRRGM